DAQRQRADRRARAQVAQASLVALDLLADASQLVLDTQDVGELARAIREQLDEPLLEAASVDHPCFDVDVLFADVLHRHAHRLELPDGAKAVDRFIESLEARTPPMVGPNVTPVVSADTGIDARSGDAGAARAAPVPGATLACAFSSDADLSLLQAIAMTATMTVPTVIVRRAKR